MTRPRLYPNDAIIAALRDCKGLVYLAAKKLGCETSTIYRRAKKSKAVSRVIEHQRGELLDTAELALYNAILKGECWAVTLALKTLGRSRGYHDEVRIEDAAPPVVINWDDLCRMRPKPLNGAAAEADPIEERIRRELELPAAPQPEATNPNNGEI
jgi:hypothetical protein